MSKSLVGLAWLFVLACSGAHAAPIAFNGSYAQQFDTLATSGSANTWVNDETVPGWHLFKHDKSSVATYRADSGTANNGAFYSYGSSGATERALGGVGSGSFEGYIALAAINTTGATINALNVRFDGEQWRNGGNTSAHTMKLEYGIGSTFADVATWTAAGAAFDWSSPVNTATAAAVDGNVAGRVPDVGGTLSSLSWAPGATLWLRWVETNDAGSDHGLAIDNLRLTTGAGANVFTPPAGTAFGSSDASTAIALDADWMVVGDDEANVLRVYPRAGGAAVREWSYGSLLGIGSSELDLEASTRIGNRLYFTGSHSNKKDGSEANNREHLFAVDVTGTGAGATFAYVAQYGGLEQALVSWDGGNAHGKGANYFGLAASSGNGVVPEASNGFSIEGMAATASGHLLLGFRAPQASAALRTRALLVPLTNPAAVLTGAAPMFGAPIELDLGGRGVRSIERTDDGKFLIIAGPAGSATASASSSNFALYVWDGSSTTAQRLDNALDSLLVATGGSFETLVSPSSTAAGTRVQLLQDNGDTVWPGRTKPSKDLAPGDQQFTGNWITLSNPVAVDTTPPALQSSTPAAGAIGVDPSTSIQLVFSEPVRNGGGSFELRAGGTLISTLPAGDTSLATFSGNTLTLRPPAGLSPNAAYVLAAVGNPVVDQAGNAWVSSNLTFTTGAPPPLTRTVLITEVNSNAAGGDFFELYNYGRTPVNLANWRWTDNSEAFSGGKVFPPNTTLAPGKALVVASETDAVAFCAAWGLASCDGVIRVSGKGLGKGDAVLLYDPNGQLVTALNYGSTSVYGANPSQSGAEAPPVADSHAGPAFAAAGTSIGNGVSAVWDGQSTRAPRYVPAAVGVAGGFAQPGQAANIGSPGTPGGAPPTSAITLISAIQGTGEASPKLGASVTVRAVVTAFRPGLSGFFLQEEAADSDGNEETSEGIFVFYGGTNPGVTDATVGQVVELKAVVGEYRNQTQLTNVTGFEVKGPAALPNPVVLTLPVADMAVLERYEGMRVEMRPASGQLVVTDTQTLGRYGTVTLSVGQPQVQFTEANAPSTSGFEAFVKATQRGQIILDDGLSVQNPPIVYGRNGQPLSAANTLRAGDSVASVVGVLDQFVDSAAAAHETSYRVQPTVAPSFSGPERPTAADFKAAMGAAGLKIASANVLNYFNVTGATTGSSQVKFNTPLGNSQGIRGANNAQELERQRAKIVANLIGLDADVYGLMEVQNNGFGAASALKDLTDALNASSDKPAGARYDYVKAPFKEGAAQVAGAGSDAITVALVYRSDRVEPAGMAAVASPATYPAFDGTVGGSRVPIAQTFAVPMGAGATDQVTVVVNHFKSKGSVLAGAGNDDQGDGQGANNAARVMAANQLKSWLDTNPTGATSSNIVLVGDFNAYGKEQPITTLEGYGFIKVSHGDSYSFDGLWGSLDHIFVSAGLQPRVGNVVKWAINAQEPVALDYNTEFNKPASFYAPTPYRSSDHNPIVLGLSMGNLPPAITGVPTTPRTVVAGEAFGLDGLTVSDPEAGVLTLTITASNARLLGLTDADTSQPGLQLQGTPTQINALLAQAAVIADAAGAALTFTLTDGANAPVVAQMAFNVTPPTTVDPANQFNLGTSGQQPVTGTVTGGGATCRVVPSPQVLTPAAAGAQGLPRPDVSLPYGMFSLRTQNCDQGAMVTVKLSFPGALPAGAEYWKWGKSADNTSAHWYPLPASIQGNMVTFALRDGGLGDDDLRVDGNIVDPGALVVAADVGPTPVPTLGQWALLLLAVFLTGLARGGLAGDARRRG
ncbi:ExeM/NucH family extracellular endonuclease [Ottowia sp. GY511]|uniref:ExeM/NucH family extracellular endonuclease n=1 Tax=Ottowia flava TaxID=2675430 RepID=A0ABW4KTS5_9BURK|nr:ExeM/NucH family extracellular endonuclease [Ottowia sp. GY511]TXK27766.1 ExeM/NucH family extracellular endonuclease [Ottowia sp. GY511]